MTENGVLSITIFIYLNDLPEGDEGETHFIRLGLKVVPRAGTAVMWDNTLPNGKADERTFHQGLPPKTGVKYGLNCFFNIRKGRPPKACVMAPGAQFAAAQSAHTLGRQTFGMSGQGSMMIPYTSFIAGSAVQYAGQSLRVPLPNLLTDRVWAGQPVVTKSSLRTLS